MQDFNRSLLKSFMARKSTISFNRVSDLFGKRIAHNRGFALTVGLEKAIQGNHAIETGILASYL